MGQAIDKTILALTCNGLRETEELPLSPESDSLSWHLLVLLRQVLAVLLHEVGRGAKPQDVEGGGHGARGSGDIH